MMISLKHSARSYHLQWEIKNLIFLLLKPSSCMIGRKKSLCSAEKKLLKAGIRNMDLVRGLRVFKYPTIKKTPWKDSNKLNRLSLPDFHPRIRKLTYNSLKQGDKVQHLEQLCRRRPCSGTTHLRLRIWWVALLL